MTALFDRVVNPLLLVRRIYVVACGVICEDDVPKQTEMQQLDLFTDYAAQEAQEPPIRRPCKKSAMCRRPCSPFEKNTEKTPYSKA